MNFFYYACICILIIGCTSSFETKEENNINLFELSKEILGDYSYSYDINRKKNSTQLIILTIPKDKFSQEDYNVIKERLVERGWENTDEYNSFYNYCKTKNYSIDILNPVNDKHYSRDGEEVNFTSKNYWYFAFYYNKLGINNCMLSKH